MTESMLDNKQGENVPKIHFAPLQGYADHVYRRLHAETYGGVDYYYTPFIRIEKGAPRRQDIARLSAPAPVNAETVPQIIFDSVDEFKTLTAEIKSLGFNRIDLNLGCPYPMQTKKGRGAAMIANTEVMEQVADLINDDHSVSYSVKMRLGMAEYDEWKSIMPILNRQHLHHIAIHPRIAREMYAGDMHPEQVKALIEESRNPVVWNGEIHTPDDIDSILQSYPTLAGVMIGRGFLARPSLAAEWREEREWSPEERLAHIMQMHAALYDEYSSTLCGPAQILQKIKPFWEYLEPEIGHKAYKTIRKATSIPRYNEAIANLNQ